MTKIIYEPCDPPIPPILFGETEPPEVSDRIRELFESDQLARHAGQIDWAVLAQADAQRRAEALGYLSQGQISAPISLYYTAFIFQHGNCPEHYRLAHQLAERALGAGLELARWLFAATLDRYLLSINQPQKYGTQFLIAQDGRWVLRPYDPETTDEERQRYNVPPLAEQFRMQG